MNKITMKRIKFKLNGELITKGKKLSFNAIDREGNKVSLTTIKGNKIISFFPAINTRVCDGQTQSIGQMASLYPEVNFISITTDDVKTINNWCLSRGMQNIVIWSDKELKEFGDATNTRIVKLKKLCRGFMILDKTNKIIDMSVIADITKDPDYGMIEKYLTKNNTKK